MPLLRPPAAARLEMPRRDLHGRRRQWRMLLLEQCGSGCTQCMMARRLAALRRALLPLPAQLAERAHHLS